MASSWELRLKVRRDKMRTEKEIVDNLAKARKEFDSRLCMFEAYWSGVISTLEWVLKPSDDKKTNMRWCAECEHFTPSYVRSLDHEYIVVVGKCNITKTERFNDSPVCLESKPKSEKERGD